MPAVALQQRQPLCLRTNTLKLIQLLVGAFLVLSPQLLAADVDELATNFDWHFRQTLKKNNIPGAAYAIVKDNRVVKVGAYGVRSVGTKSNVDAYTVFRLASVSKLLRVNCRHCWCIRAVFNGMILSRVMCRLFL